MRVLVVEDEALVAMLVEDAVREAGCTVALTASNIQDAVAAAATDGFDVALLDMNLNGQKAHALPVLLKARGKPFAFVTGYGESGVLDEFRAVPIVTKPFRVDDIVGALEALRRGLDGPVETAPHR
ncbi:MAG: response regulator [Sphingomonadaceae bacterium]|nr:response regulator [Sphingomonadaceae bacterium]